ncbi:MAG: bifunctional 2-C-methyl-D-erythritol 4-phosphate cytidylyltransferase/2-C-methyl-D-erythritol 2,4-cyclodiphosphate synthase [Pseudomonadota bacterium]
MSVAAVIVAAGRGTRLGGPVPKQYRLLAGEPVLARTVRHALACSGIDRIIVAIGPGDEPAYAAALAEIDDRRLVLPVTGGATRADSVRAALEGLAGDPPSVVLVHDAARPFAEPDLWSRLIRAVDAGAGAIAAEPVVDALWRQAGDDADPLAEDPVPRAGLWRAQTPQAFPYATLLAAHRAEAAAAGPPALDDAEVYRRAGHAVRLVEASPKNFKITTATDLARAEEALASGNAPSIGGASALPDIRSGHGFDVHRFGPGDHVWLCGIKVPHNAALIGHSDADVGLHALSDALYGALAEGDIGTHFPPTDPQWKGAESHVFLSHAGARVRARGGRIANVDLTLLCERPRIGPHAGAMRARLAEILEIDAGRIGLKATTMERMGFIGRSEGMGCIANATVILPGTA